MKTNTFSLKIINTLVIILFIAAASGVAFSQPGNTNNTTTNNTNSKKKSKEMGWRIKDFRPYIQAIKELEKLNKEYSINILKLANDEFFTGLDILEDMENDINKVIESNKSKKYLNERFYWQEIDRRNREQRLLARKKFEAKMKAVTYFHKAIVYLDKVQNSEVRQNESFIDFQSRLFQVYVSTQYDLHNFKPCIPILERYLKLRKENKKDIWAYKYLASCYGYMEKVLTKYKHASEDQILKYKNKKNESMLMAVELKYGRTSPHYKHLQEVVEKDEKKSIRINNFK